MLLADKNHLRSVAFPLIASGINGFPDKKAFSIAKVAIQNYISAKSDILVYLLIYDKSDIDLNEMLKLNVAKYVQSKFVHDSQKYMLRAEVCQVGNLTDFPEDNDLEKSLVYSMSGQTYIIINVKVKSAKHIGNIAFFS